MHKIELKTQNRAQEALERKLLEFKIEWYSKIGINESLSGEQVNPVNSRSVFYTNDVECSGGSRNF